MKEDFKETETDILSQLPSTYTTVRTCSTAEFEEKRSLLIGYAKPTRTEEQALAFITQIKQKHKDATHNCYAYIVGQNAGIMRYSDDGEPGGTAGMPIIEVMKARGVVDCAVVVTRYFGGILLGAGGLVRAYSHTAKLALEAAHIITYEQYTELQLTCSYSDYQRYQAELPRFAAVVDDTQFSDRVTLLFAVKSTVVDALVLRVREMSGGKDAPVVMGTRFDYR